MSKPVSIEQQIKCVSRELKLRETCYPKWVKKKRMSQEQADAEIMRMKAVLETLKQVRPLQAELSIPKE